MNKNELIITILGYLTVMNFIVTTYIIFTDEIKQVNITYVCPTARKYMSEKEIQEIEKEVENKIKKILNLVKSQKKHIRKCRKYNRR